MASKRSRFRAGIAVAMLWAAVGVSSLITTVSLWLCFDMDAILEQAVIDGRAFPFTGEADELAMPPGVAAMVGIPVSIAMFFVVAMAARRARSGRVSRRAVAISALVSAVVWGLTVAYVADYMGAERYGLYSGWYEPFLVTTGLLYAACLIGALLVRRRRS
jgi:hypothetical protein